MAGVGGGGDGGGDGLDFKSKAFDPVRALSSLDVRLPDPDAEEYEDLNYLREAVHGQSLRVVRELPGVLGPGGIPKLKERQIPIGRSFTEDQGPIKGRGPKRRRNVITRMEEMTGPLAVLRDCQKDNIRVKVYTRNHSEVRGLLTGYVVAFDKHWNLALRDVDEIFQKKLRCKTPALGDVTRFVSVGDLSLKDSESDSSEDSPDPATGTEVAGTGSASAGKGPLSAGTGSEEEEEGRSDGRRVIGGSSSIPGGVEAMDLRAKKSLRLSIEQSGWTSEAQDARRLGLEAGRKARKREEEEEVKEEGKEGKTKRRVRKRMKREIRKRHVNQLFIRGENVVLVSVLKP